MIIIDDVEQMSPEWYALRAGIPTASRFDKIVTTKGAPSKQAEKYLYQLAGEKVSGQAVETYQSEAMARGIEMEGEARGLFEMVHGVSVKTVGLCYSDEQKKFSCSPDGLLEDAGLEIKCPLIQTHVGYLLENKLPTEYIQQVQGSMFVTGLPAWWFISYFPGLPALMLKVEWDEAFISKLSGALDDFCGKLAITIRKLKELT